VLALYPQERGEGSFLCKSLNIELEILALMLTINEQSLQGHEFTESCLKEMTEVAS